MGIVDSFLSWLLGYNVDSSEQVEAPKEEEPAKEPVPPIPVSEQTESK